MKIRNGFVSNSSSASFMIPSFLLTDEQKEMLLSLDENKTFKQEMKEKMGFCINSSENDYPSNDGYHKVFDEMVQEGKWHDYDWDIGENKKQQMIRGAAMMDNGSLREFMEKIGIDVTASEFVNDGHMSVHMATHPESIAHFVKLYHEFVDDWNQKSEEDKQFDRDHGFDPIQPFPYEIDRSEFEVWGDGQYAEIQGGEYSYYYVIAEAEKHES